MKDGVKVAIKDRPETEEVIPAKALDESVGKAAFTYADRWLGPREEIGSKGRGSEIGCAPRSRRGGPR